MKFVEINNDFNKFKAVNENYEKIKYNKTIKEGRK